MGEQLKRRAKRAAASRAGLDGLKAKVLAQLPEDFWDEFALIANRMIEKGADIPSAWRHVTVCLFPKEDSDDMRPISVTSICWRLIAGVTLGNLGEWIAQDIPDDWVLDEWMGGWIPVGRYPVGADWRMTGEQLKRKGQRAEASRAGLDG